MLAVKGASMERWLCWAALVVAGLFLVLFLLDLIFSLAGIPFQPFSGMDPVLDFLGAACSGLLVWLSWNALRELR
jgi:hypothetical protein